MRILALLIVTAAGFVSGCGSTTIKADCDQRLALERSWRQAVAADDEAGRRLVAAYVIDCGALDGSSRRQVRAVFGKPDEADDFGMYYYLGPDGIHIDDESLAIMFGPDGTVNAADVAQG